MKRHRHIPERPVEDFKLKPRPELLAVSLSSVFAFVFVALGAGVLASDSPGRWSVWAD